MSSNEVLNFAADIAILAACVYLIFVVRENNKKSDQ